MRILVVITVLASYAMHGQNPFQKDKEEATNYKIPQLIELNGVVERLYIDDCEFTFSESDFGLHLKVATNELQEVHVHLGPVWATSIWTEGIEGQAVHLVVFRYKHLGENEYVAKELHWDGHTAVLRDENLMPFWINGYNQGVW
ncbi:MAG: hypothetical protein AAGC45_06990 [Bacteroidota bacterium]